MLVYGFLAGRRSVGGVTLVREAGRDDSSGVAALLECLYREIGHVLPKGPAIGEVTAKLIAGEPRYRALLAFDAGREEPIGVLTLGESCAPYAGGYFGIVQEFYIVPELRSRGVGQAMLQHARDVAREKGWSRLEVTAALDPSFERTVDFYRRYGFEDSGPRLYLPIASH